jgi:hypothetical protein
MIERVFTTFLIFAYHVGILDPLKQAFLGKQRMGETCTITRFSHRKMICF